MWPCYIFNVLYSCKCHLATACTDMCIWVHVLTTPLEELTSSGYRLGDMANNCVSMQPATQYPECIYHTYLMTSNKTSNPHTASRDCSATVFCVVMSSCSVWLCQVFVVTSSPSVWLHQVVLKQICQNLDNALFSHFTISLTFCKPYSTECGWFPWLLRSLYLILLTMHCSITRWGVQGRAQERLERWETRLRVFTALLL